MVDQNIIKRKLVDLNNQIDELKSILNNSNQNNKERFDIIVQMENIKNNIEDEYISMLNSHNEDSKKISQIENNIFNSIESYDQAFTKAGAIFKLKR